MKHYWTHDDRIFCSNEVVEQAVMPSVYTAVAVNRGDTVSNDSTTVTRTLRLVSCPDCLTYIEAAIQRYQAQRNASPIGEETERS